MASPLKAFIQHPKKSFFFTGVASAALWLTYDYTVTNDAMKTCCKKAARYGDERIRNPSGNVRHITVILNPVAGNRKAKKLYTNYVEPILHLAGIKVSLVETKSPNQAYELMKIMSNCDGVAIVGGDGTVHEALNGLLDRPDKQEAVAKIPIGIIPVGQYNSIARYLHQGFIGYRNQKEFLINSTMRIVQSCKTKYDVLKIDPLDHDVDSEINHENKSTYALRDVRYGIYQDNFFKVGGYFFYENNIKPYWLRFKTLIRRNKNPEPKIDSISYTEPCTGCSRCIDRHRLVPCAQVEKSEKPASSNKKWWSILGSVDQSKSGGPSEDELKELELMKRDNPDCGKWINFGDTSGVTEYRACMMGDRKVRLSVGRNREYVPSDVTETQDIRLRVSSEIERERKVAEEKPSALQQDDDSSATANDTPKQQDEKQTTKFLVDGQPMQAQSVEITAISKAVTIFTGAPKLD